MRAPEPTEIAYLQREWTDRRVRVKTGARPELDRFAQRIGRIVTINFNGLAIVDFGDGAWYDVDDFAAILEVVSDEAEAKQYDGGANSAQKQPSRQS